MPISKCGQNGGHDRSQLMVESWKTFSVSLIKQILLYLKMIFGKNYEQTMRQLQFKLDPLPTESVEICLFHERWIKAFDTQPFGQLYIKYGLIFQKINLVQFCNKYMVGLSQKNSVWALGKWKMKFSCKENENSLQQHCLPFQDAPLCTI